MACKIDRNSIVKAVQKQAVTAIQDSNLFKEEDGLYAPISEKSDYQKVVADFDQRFPNVIMRMNQDQPAYAIVEPDEETINKYLNVAPEQDIVELRRVTKTPQFRKWFGNWELIQKVISLKDNVQGPYRIMLDTDPQQLMYETAVQANSSESEKSGATKAVGEEIVNLSQKLFPKAKVGDIYQPVVGELDETGQPLLRDGMYTNASGERKSALNRGSFLSAKNDTKIDPKYPQYENFMVNVTHQGRKVGEAWVENDGEYLTLYSIQLATNGSENVGTNAHLKLAALAKEMGLTFRSDSLPKRMSEASIRTWERFVAAGQAERIRDRYVFTGTPEGVTGNVYLSASPIERLNEEQDSQFRKLQDLGLISKRPNGKYYKIMGDNQLGRLKTIIRAKGLDFVNIIDEKYVQLGRGVITQAHDHAFETPDTTTSKAGEITKRRVLQWLDKIGFRNVQTVNELIYNGQRLNASAYIDFAKGVIQIVQGREDYTLPEEAMTVLTELIKESRPELYKEMMTQVVNYQLYRDLLNDPNYTVNNRLLYSNEDGTLNYDKLKHEAVTKLLAEFLINKLENTTESAQRVNRVYEFWQRILDFIRSVFGKYRNPFTEALSSIESDDLAFGEYSDLSSDDIFLSAKSVDDIDDETPDNKQIFEKIKERPNRLNIDKIDDQYYRDGQLVPKVQRVSAQVDAYYEKLFGTKRNFDESLQAFYEQSRQDGSYLHEVIEEIVNSWIDPQTGIMNRNQKEITFPLQNNPLKGKMVANISNYIKKFMAAYPTGTRFISEQIIYDEHALNPDGSRGRYGTIDLLAIKPDGEIDIIDWKSMLLQDLQGAKDYKKGAIDIQMKEYRRILKDDYGFEKFGKIRAIPIKKYYKTDKLGQKSLSAIEIGNVDPSKIKKDDRYLRPIISSAETTGSESKDEMIQNLNKLYQKYIEKGYFKKDRNILEDVQESIYEMQVTNTVNQLANYLVDLRTKFVQMLNDAKRLDTTKKDDVNEFLALISFYNDIVDKIVIPSFNLTEDVSIDKASRAKLVDAASKVSYLKQKLDKIRDEILASSAAKEGIFDLLKPEKIVNLARRWFRSMGSQDIASVRYMYELTKQAYGKLDIAVDKELKKLKNLKSDFDNWIKKSGLSTKDAIGKLINYQKGALHSKIDPKFFDERQATLESRDAKKIKKFISDNYDLDEYDNWYKKTLEENKEIWKNAVYDTDPKANERVKKIKLLQFQKNYDWRKYPITAFGYHNTRIWSKNIKEDNWLSEEYKEIQKHPELVALYDFFVQKNKELVEVGAIEDWQAYTFFPNVRKSFADIMSLDDKDFLSKVMGAAGNAYNNWKKSLTVEDYELNYQGARDAFTGEKLEKRFVPYIQQIKPEDQSFDIFTVYGLMSKEIHKERYLQENDEILRSLLNMERMKPNLQQNKFGTVETDEIGRPKVGTEVGKNSEILAEHVRAVVNGEHMQYDADYVIKFKLREKWNHSPLGKLYRFDIDKQYNPTQVSATKFIMWLNTVNQKRILGINAASAISNLFGGSFSSSKLYQKYTSKEDIRAAWLKMTSGAFYATEDMKKNAALVDFFLPLLQNREHFKAKQLSVNDATTVLSQDWLMSPMRKTSEIVQLNVFFAVLENTGVIDGKLVNLRERAMQETDYTNRYSQERGKISTSAEISDIEEKFKDKLKELKEKYSLTKFAKYKTIKEGGKDKVVLEIPGIEREDADVQHLREIVQTMSKDSLGEADEFDIANYKYSLWWRLFMTFKNWIPRMADVRFGEFRYDQAHHSYEYGRFRMFAKSLSASYIQTVLKLVPIPYITGATTKAAFGKNAIIQRALEVYQEKIDAAKALGKYNPETFISQGEFVDRFIQGTESTFAEVRTLLFMCALLFTGVAAPDDDDDNEDKAYKALARKQINKLIDEVGFFYSPKSGIDIAGGAAPVTGLIKDGWYLFTDLNQQFFGFTFEQLGWDEKGLKMQESAKPIKRTFKMIPALKEILNYLPAIDDETAKDWGVRINDRRGY